MQINVKYEGTQDSSITEPCFGITSELGFGITSELGIMNLQDI